MAPRDARARRRNTRPERKSREIRDPSLARERLAALGGEAVLLQAAVGLAGDGVFDQAEVEQKAKIAPAHVFRLADANFR